MEVPRFPWEKKRHGMVKLKTYRESDHMVTLFEDQN